MGNWRIPWNYRVYRGKGHPSPAELGRRLLKSLPKEMRKTFKIMVLADSAFGSVAFLTTVRHLKLYAIVGVPKTRKLVDGRSLAQLHKGGQHLYLKDLPFPVSIAHYYFTTDDGRKVKRYLISTRQLKPSTIVWWGKRRWQIEGWFKTVKHRFSLHRFGQSTLLGVHRWLVLCLISFVLALWGYWINGLSSQPDWGLAAQTALEFFFPTLVLSILLLDIQKQRSLANEHGIDIQVSRWNI
ncbi:transposase [Gloeocapsa sp. PCC 73106]|uniref:transposase n=1 Tax=Gloeocapsa sp. PCC 73106 TaxID=102232 RepID=UPI0002ACAB02|nr:transposase [Gloeocapsa sp. PCC 73106]ELR99182.1 transposase family protein [Gloeocapsa sp. PCC 73106]